MTSEAKLALLYVPCGSEEEAVAIAKALLGEGLIACANICESRSLYMWEGELADEREFVLFMKTTVRRIDRARQLINDLHSYEVPCILAIEPTSANDAYVHWVFGQLSSPADTAPSLQVEVR